ncbi:MAG: nucleoside-diphosphate kinase [Candidatus Eisenbacteria bacterium]|nr:nucleoside-diphosphate kinase [Candidatus Eisenbacteria bacterium]
MDRTFLLIKPSAVSAGNVGGIISCLEDAGFAIAALTMKTMSREEAARFYDVHAGKEFYEPLMDYMTSGPTVGMLLEAEDAIAALRRTVGATDPAQAAEGTIRARYGRTVRQNAVHASDSPERVEHEADIYFGTDGTEAA